MSKHNRLVVKPHQPATHQASIAEGLSPDADENKPDYPSLKRLETVRDNVDLTITVFVLEDRYHTCTGLPGCPEIIGSVVKGPLAVAVRRKLSPCKKCKPIDYRSKREKPQTATLEAFR